jgi:hypothetical protein
MEFVFIYRYRLDPYQSNLILVGLVLVSLVLVRLVLINLV